MAELLLPGLLLQHADMARDSSHTGVSPISMLEMWEWNKGLCGTEISQPHLEKVGSCWKVARLLSQSFLFIRSLFALKS